MIRTATISECSRYRYNLRRAWQDGNRFVCFIMLNPSTADAEIDDPTIRRCIGFGKSWGFDALEVVNLFGWRETEPKFLITPSDPIGPENDAAIIEASNRSELVVCAWGSHALALWRSSHISEILKARPLHCLGTTKNGSPKHPLYISGAQQPVIWRDSIPTAVPPMIAGKGE